VKSVRCPRCGFMTFASASECKSCKAQFLAGDSAASQMSPQSFSASSPRPSAKNSSSTESNGGSAKTVGVIFLLLVCAMVAAAYTFRGALFERFGGSLKYVEAIKQSPEFKSPVWVRANQQEIPVSRDISGFGEMARFLHAGIVVREVEVLQSLGFLDVVKYETTEAGPSRFLLGQQTYQAKHYRINLTSLGEKEAANWETVHEPFVNGSSSAGSQPLAWWHVPIGDREFGAVTKVSEVIREAGQETVDVEFSYKWRPNNIGLAFDRGNPATDAIPASAREAAHHLAWDSRKTYLAVAHMERFGGQWRVAGVTFSSEEDVRKALTYAVY
jgi:hypothetical protein